MNRRLVLVLSLATGTQVSDAIEIRSPQERTSGRFGLRVLGISDLNGDGIGELAVGSREVGEVASDTVYILDGRDFSTIRRLVTPNPVSDPSFLGAGFGVSMVEVPDLDGDQVPELAVGALQEDYVQGQGAIGRVHVFSTTSGKVLYSLADPRGERNNWYANSVAALRSSRVGVTSRIAVGVPGSPAELGTSARIYLHDAVSKELLLTIQKPDARVWFGVSMASLGDVNGDGWEDLVVGAGPQVPPFSSGAAYIVSGGDGRILHELVPPTPSDLQFRWAVAAVPDINGDGINEVLVGIGGGARSGAPRQSGHAYVFSGADGALLRCLVSPNEKASGGFGWSVAGVPDVTGDGAGELLVGAGINPSITGFSTYGERCVYLLDGSTGRTIRVFSSPHSGESMGWNVSALLGTNGELRSVIAGVARDPDAASRTGRVFAFPICAVAMAPSPVVPRLSVQSQPGVRYDLQSTAHLGDAWTSYSNITTGVKPTSISIEASRAEGQRLYRAVELP